MKYIKYAVWFLNIILTLFLIRYNIVFLNVFVQIMFYAIYYSLNACVIYSLNPKKTSDNRFIIILALNYLICCFVGSPLFGIVLLFLLIVLFRKNTSLSIVSIPTIVICSFLLLISFGLSSISKGEEVNRVDSPNKKMSLSIIYADSGATGGSYVYIAEIHLINGQVSISRRIALEKNLCDVEWIDDNEVMIGGSKYKIKFP